MQWCYLSLCSINVTSVFTYNRSVSLPPPPLHAVVFSSDFDWNSIETANLPETYKTNTAKEKLLLQVADNFHRQYSHLCPDREPLFLHPINECGVEVSGNSKPPVLV